jgi:hypothetical protein
MEYLDRSGVSDVTRTLMEHLLKKVRNMYMELAPMEVMRLKPVDYKGLRKVLNTIRSYILLKRNLVKLWRRAIKKP